MLVYKEIDSGISGIGMTIVLFAHLPNLEESLRSIALLTIADPDNASISRIDLLYYYSIKSYWIKL
jgi:hypothetical protein